jgi:hypothetical protein
LQTCFQTIHKFEAVENGKEYNAYHPSEAKTVAYKTMKLDCKGVIMKAATGQSITYSYSLLVHPPICSDQNVTIISLYEREIPCQNQFCTTITHYLLKCETSKTFPHETETHINADIKSNTQLHTNTNTQRK